MPTPPRLAFVYLGRRGAMARFTLDLARALADEGVEDAAFIIARDNELAARFDALPLPVTRLDLFSSGAGAVLQLGKLLAARRAFANALSAARADAAVELMPHVWSPFLEDIPKRSGASRIAVIHDAKPHPGDASALANRWLLGSALRADGVVTLSRYLADQIAAAHPAARVKLTALFHPDFTSATPPSSEAGPLRALFMGRLMAYKGLDLFVDAAERVRAAGAPIEVGVFGAGDIGKLRPRLDRLGAEVVNRWLSDAEIEAALARYDVVAATHREASQSGVLAAAFGAGRPVLATPVGALPEQVAHERTGLVAARADAEAVAAALLRLARDRNLVARLAEAVRNEAPGRSMSRFARALAAGLARQRSA